jgi:hypothetical protein
MEYDYVPLPHRKPLIWPNGARVALVMTFNLETWDLTKPTKEKYYAGGPAVLPDVLAGDTPDFPNYTWREYGQRVGIWRLFDLFDELGVKASCTTNAVTFERRKAMADLKHYDFLEAKAQSVERQASGTRAREVW